MKSPWFEHVVNGTKTVFATVNLLTTQRFQVDDILTIVETDEHRVETGLNVHVKITAPPRRYRSIEQFLDAELARAFPGLDAQQAKDTQYYQIPPKLRDTYYQKGLIVFSVVPISKPWKPFRS